MLLEVQWENCYTTWIAIQLCCFLAGIYVCVHLFGCQNKSTCFQKFKYSSNVFYARERQTMLVAKRPAALCRSYIAAKWLVKYKC